MLNVHAACKMLMYCSVEVECYCLYHKCGHGADSQSVENQVEQEEEPAEEICRVYLAALVSVFYLITVVDLGSVWYTFHSM